jgi:hypothetical protein
VALVVFPQSFACRAVGLAWKSSGEDINPSSPFGAVKCFDIVVRFCIWKMVLQHTLAERVALAVQHVGPPHPLGSQVEATNAAE